MSVKPQYKVYWAPWITFILGKVSGIVGITLVLNGHRDVGGVMLGVAFGLIGLTTLLCVMRMLQVPDQEFEEIARIPYP